jgi:hypothetical protein
VFFTECSTRFSPQNVLDAAKGYICPTCYARKPLFQTPPASALKFTEFNDRVLVDLCWILCEDAMVKQPEPALGTPAHKKKEKLKAEKILKWSPMCFDHH